MLPRYMMMRWVLVLAVGGWAAAPALAGDVDGESASPFGRGVYGLATHTSNNNYGVYG